MDNLDVEQEQSAISWIRRVCGSTDRDDAADGIEALSRPVPAVLLDIVNCNKSGLGDFSRFRAGGDCGEKKVETDDDKDFMDLLLSKPPRPKAVGRDDFNIPDRSSCRHDRECVTRKRLS